MARIILITGGGRSGKSSYAYKLAEALAGTRAFIATGLATDEEMRERIRQHQMARVRSGAWHTIEEPRDLAGALRQARSFDVVVVDCLTFWVNNVMFVATGEGSEVKEEDIERLCRDFLDACSEHPGTIIFVTNEVGMGIIPDSPLARRYRDLLGCCNQAVAARADVVTLVACGIPLHLKQG
ncbi:MAG: bifunctional adenosylcobinamide kinase/adenosylcobinamide-phosphate guanylyltransferase [Planctomycetes bacterium]|nr:bifunctional adenosylcobinamide kinase/adenosylcobinamide-phosphate guanylyltransferase [Planctomycetota bacterium]